MLKYKIYQVTDECPRSLRFARFVSEDKVDPNNYELVYEAELDSRDSVNVILERLFVTFNTAIPDGFTGHSMSVSDIVCLQDSYGIQNYYYVDSIGFKRLEFFGDKVVTDIEWDTDGEHVALPKTVAVDPKTDDDDVADLLSDTFGFCVFGFAVLNRKVQKKTA